MCSSPIKGSPGKPCVSKYLRVSQLCPLSLLLSRILSPFFQAPFIMKLIVAGSTGYVATEVIRQALSHPAITSIIALAGRTSRQGPAISMSRSALMARTGRCCMRAPRPRRSAWTEVHSWCMDQLPCPIASSCCGCAEPIICIFRKLRFMAGPPEVRLFQCMRCGNLLTRASSSQLTCAA